MMIAAILLQTPLYESTSLLLVKFGRELVYRPEIGGGRSYVSPDKTAVINSELAILRSRPVLEGVVRSIGVPVLYPSLTEAFTLAKTERESKDEESQAETMLIAEAAALGADDHQCNHCNTMQSDPSPARAGWVRRTCRPVSV